jgi:putative protease
MQKASIPELLSPCGSKEALFAAINAKADAVYLGGKEFGARQFATNFSEQELKNAITTAHLRNVKVYVTINTLIKDVELKRIADYLIWLYEIGTDAIIVQDIGVVKLSKEIVPNLPIHASTQMAIHSEDGVKYALELGIKRVILARETKLLEIKKAYKNLKSCNVELEVFVHGALCYSYSGRCLISFVLGGRSGNRGACAQPCRKTYSLLVGKKDEYGRPIELSNVPLKEQYLLSTRDLSVYEKLPSIVGNVDSIKIEGRMKSPLYVAIVTDIYRKALDNIAKGTFKPSTQDIMDLKLAFNREFTQGYMLECKTVMARDKPDNRGLYIGDVISYDYKNKKVLIKLKSKLILEQGDGILFLSEDGLKKQGLMINKAPKIVKNIMYLDIGNPIDFARVYLTRKQSLIKKYKNIISTPQFNDIPICIDIELLEDNTIRLHSKFKGKNLKDIECKLVLKNSIEDARNNPLTKSKFEKQFRKSKGTPFKVSYVNIKLSKNKFAPIGKINEFRRNLLEKSANALLESYIPKSIDIPNKNKILNFVDIEKNSIQKLKKVPCLAIYVDSIDALTVAVSFKCDRIYFEPKINFKEDSKEITEIIKQAILICSKNKRSQFIWKLPFISEMENLEMIIDSIHNLIKFGLKEIMIDCITSIFKQFKSSLKISGSYGLNVFNNYTVSQLSSMFDTLTLSSELSIYDIKNLMSKLDYKTDKICNLELVVQGNLEVMISKDSFFSKYCKNLTQNRNFLGLKDSKGKIFPIYEDSESKIHIFNAVELSLINYMPDLFDVGLSAIVIDARNHTDLYVEKIVKMYQDAMKYTLDDDEKLKE